MKDSALSAGTYTVAITDALGCTGTGSVTITQPSQIIITTHNYTVCAGSQVTMSASASGGTGALSYVWDFDSATYDTATVLALANISYKIYVHDGNGCFVSAYDSIFVNPLPVVNLNAQTYTVCTTATSDSLSGFPPGGTYAGPHLVGNIFNPSAAGAGTFSFTYTYTDPNTHCSNVGTQSIIVSLCTGIPGVNDNARIAVYPNPANNQFTVQLQSGDEAQLITMYNVTGQEVYAHKYTTSENSQLSIINSQLLPNGVYFLKVVLQDGNTLVQKVDIVK